MPLELKPNGIFRVSQSSNRADSNAEAVSNYTIKFNASVEGESSGFLAQLKRFPDEVAK